MFKNVDFILNILTLESELPNNGIKKWLSVTLQSSSIKNTIPNPI